MQQQGPASRKCTKERALRRLGEGNSAVEQHRTVELHTEERSIKVGCGDRGAVLLLPLW